MSDQDLGVEFLDELGAAYNRVADGPLKYQELRGGIRRALLPGLRYPIRTSARFSPANPARLASVLGIAGKHRARCLALRRRMRAPRGPGPHRALSSSTGSLLKCTQAPTGGAILRVRAIPPDRSENNSLIGFSAVTG